MSILFGNDWIVIPLVAGLVFLVYMRFFSAFFQTLQFGHLWIGT